MAHEVARLAINDGHTILPLVLLDGLPFEMPSVQPETNKVHDSMDQLRIEEYATEAFSDPLLWPLGANFRTFCTMEKHYQPYTFADVELASLYPAPSIWLYADLYMTQCWKADVLQYRSLGIAITIVATLPDCTHLTMLRHPTVRLLARQIQQRAKPVTGQVSG